MKVLAANRRALYEYQVLDKYKAGISLLGFEVKALREGKADFTGSFIKPIDGKLKVINLHIGRFSKQGDIIEYDPNRPREILLQDFEVQRLLSKSSQKGYSIAPLKFIDDHGLIKLELALVKGKKRFEKKEQLKERQQERDLKRELKEVIKS